MMKQFYLSTLLSALIIVPVLCDGREVTLHGDNICTVDEERTNMVLQKHSQQVVMESTHPCLDITRGFMCKVKSNGTKLSYKGVPMKEKVAIQQCCIGFRQTPDATCEQCFTDFYGTNCSSRCNCTEDQICDPVFGCCNLESDSCRFNHAEFLKQAQSRSPIIFLVIAIGTVISAFLFASTLIYRRKYRKEKDPDMPTVAYYPDGPQFMSSSDIEAREFSNPLYRVADTEPNKFDETDASADDGYESRSNHGTSELNDYATIDEVSNSTAGPSSTDPLLTNF